MGFVKLLLLVVLTCEVSAEVDRPCNSTTSCSDGNVCENKLCKIPAAGVCTTEQTTAAPQTDTDETTAITLDKNTTTGENPTKTESTFAPNSTIASTNTTTEKNTSVTGTTIQPTKTNTSTAAHTSSTPAVNTTQPSVSTTEPDKLVTIATTITTNATTTAESTTKGRKRRAVTQKCVANADCLSGDNNLTCHCKQGHTAGSDGLCQKDNAAGSNHKASVWIALAAVILLLMK